MDLIKGLTEGLGYLPAKLTHVLLSGGSSFSLTSLACALFVALGYLVWRRRVRNRRVRLRTLTRALLPRRIANSPSAATDIGYFLFSIFLFGIMFGWAVMSYRWLSNCFVEWLVAAFGPLRPTSLSEIVVRGVVTAAVFVAYELGYWFDHWLKHRVPILWEFHKVHHSAHVLTPLTLFRVHPLDTLIFVNILAVSVAFANGLTNYLFGMSVPQFSVADTNVILVVFIHAYVHLQHSHFWIAFNGWLGRVFISPAHHQIHHSTDPQHFNRNFGSCLALWDWMFGTLHIPSREPQKLKFGVEDLGYDPHSLPAGMALPLRDAAAHLAPALKGTAASPSPQIDAKVAP